jgi:hypothetical protein
MARMVSKKNRRIMPLGVKRGMVLFSFKGLQGRLLFVYFTHNIAAGAHDMALY